MHRRTARRGLVAALVVTAASVGVLASPGSGAISAPDAPMEAARFSLTIDGYEIASFSELQGITAEVKPTDYMVSGSGGMVTRKLAGAVQPVSVVLKRGLTSSVELWTWHEAVRNGNMAVARKNVSLVMYASDGRPVARYWLENAWPSKLEIGAIKAGASEVLFETVHLTAEAMQRVAP